MKTKPDARRGPRGRNCAGRSIYMRDPNGYVVELTASAGVQQEIMDTAVSKPRESLARWQAAKPGQPGAAA